MAEQNVAEGGRPACNQVKHIHRQPFARLAFARFAAGEGPYIRKNCRTEPTDEGHAVSSNCHIHRIPGP